MLRLCANLLACLLALAALLCPAAADEAAGDAAEWSTVRPPDWPLALALPAAGELLLAGVDGVTAEELGARDLQWYDPARGDEPGALYLLSAASLPLARETDEARDKAWRARLTGELRGELLAVDTVRAGGHNWRCYRVRQPDDGIATAQTEFVLAVTAAGEREVEVWCHYARPHGELTRRELARILGGGRR
jgi:hypothetical protein